MMHPPTGAAPARPSRWWLPALLGLWNLAVAQPLYDTVGKHPEFLVAHRTGAAFLIVGAGVLSLAVPLALALLYVAARRVSPRLAEAGYLTVLAALGSLAALTILNLVFSGPGAVLLGAGLAVGVLLAFAYSRIAAARSLLGFLSLGVLLFPAAFLLSSPASTLVRRSAPEAAVGRGAKLSAPIFMIVFDELSTVSLLDEAGEIDGRLFPNFARLARTAHWFRSSSSVCSQTDQAIPAILTGKYPDPTKLPTAADHPVNLFTLLAPSHRVEAFETVTDLCPTSICGDSRGRDAGSPAAAVLSDLAVVYSHLVAPVDFRDRLPSLAGRWSGFAATETGRRINGIYRKEHFEAFLDSIEIEKAPKLTFIHSLLPHVPYQFLPGGAVYLEGQRMAGWVRDKETWVDDEVLVGQAYQRYLLQLQFVDGLIGRFLDKLQGLDLFEQSLIVVTADHGVGFQPGGSRRHISAATAATLVPVPLFVKLPRQVSGSTSDANVEAIDILATVVDALGVQSAATFDGVSVLEARRHKPAIKRASAGNKLFDFPADLLPMMLPEAARARSRFGVSDGGLDLWREGLARRHLGRRIESYKVVNPSAIRATVHMDSWYLWSRPAGESLPILLSGELETAGEGNSAMPTLVAALNGQVSGVSRAFPGKNGQEFSILLQPEHLRPEGNDLRLFVAATQADGDFELAPIVGERRQVARLTAARANKDATSIDYRGRTFVVSGADIAGQVDLLLLDGPALRIAGWAGDVGQTAGATSRNRPPIAILVFAGGLQVSELTRLERREDVAEVMGESLADSGFAIDVSSTVLDSTGPASLKVLALFDSGTAAELRLPELTSGARR